LGGGAGALVPSLATSLRVGHHIPRDAEVISSVGDALSLVRVEIERTLSKATTKAVAELHLQVETAAIEAGADPSTLQIESRAVPERGALRVTAFGSAALSAEAMPFDRSNNARIVPPELGEAAEMVFANDFYSVFTEGAGDDRHFVVVDGHGSIALRGRGQVLVGPGAELKEAVAERIGKSVRHYGPIAVAPALRVLRGTRLADMTLFSDPERALEAVATECSLGSAEDIVVFLTRD
jgi:hypothetical protein